MLHAQLQTMAAVSWGLPAQSCLIKSQRRQMIPVLCLSAKSEAGASSWLASGLSWRNKLFLQTHLWRHPRWKITVLRGYPTLHCVTDSGMADSLRWNSDSVTQCHSAVTYVNQPNDRNYTHDVFLRIDVDSVTGCNSAYNLHKAN